MRRTAKQLEKDINWTYVGMFSAVVLLLWILTACSPRGIAPDRMIRHPDAPALIMDARGDAVLLYLWSKEHKALIEYGWVKVDEYEGWTFTKFDWSKKQ